jgi:NhaA family Na+:H+ antiporter
VRPLQGFLESQASGALLLLAAVIVALLWANGPWRDLYERMVHTPIQLRLGSLVDIDEDLHFWVNDGLMTIFFFLVGLEIKREFVSGELRRLRVAALPVVAAVGGMVIPALLYLSITIGAGGDATRGWGVPMATDIAFALGVLVVAGATASARLRPALLTLAIVDDIGAIVVIAVFYSDGVSFVALVLAIAAAVSMLGLRRLDVRSWVPYAALGLACWYATLQAGVHPTIAGVALGLLTPALAFQRPAVADREARRLAEEIDAAEDPEDRSGRWMRMGTLSAEAISPLERTEHVVLPWATYFVLPVFALVNAGVHLSVEALQGALSSPIAIGIFVGLVFGKPLGIVLFSAGAVRSKVATLPEGTGWTGMMGLGAVAGIGFTVALFVAELAFSKGPTLDEAKIAILAASVVAAIIGSLVLRLPQVSRRHHGEQGPAREASASPTA